jgi:RimJ/RimL family protein N-acetyltransferase
MFARTQRLVLRPGWVDDAPTLAQTIGKPEIARKLAQMPWPYGIDEATAFLSRPYDPAAPQALILLRTAGKPRLIGGVGLTHADGGLELGYWIAQEYWGLGFATEASRAFVDMARDTLRRPQLLARHFADNPASGRVLRKLGFAPTGKVGPCPCAARKESSMSIEYALDLAAQGDGADDMAFPDRMAA